jgi:hypothetical protein
VRHNAATGVSPRGGPNPLGANNRNRRTMKTVYQLRGG